jgi:hypothetical protein
VLPAELIGQPGFIVYLLAATTEPGVTVMGGHYRAHMSEDGKRLLGIRPFSKACMEMKPDAPADGKLVGMVVTHLLDPTPVETHVFISLNSRLPLVVSTGKHLWQIVPASPVEISILAIPE